MSVTFRRLTHHLADHQAAVALLLFSIAGASIANLVSPWPLQILIDNIIGDKPLFGHPLTGEQRTQWLIIVAAAYLTVMGVRGLFLWVRHLRLAALGESFQKELTEKAFLHVARLPLAFHNRSRAGDLAGRITGDVEKIRTSYLEMFALVAGESLTLVGAMLVMLRVDWLLALVMLVSLLPLAFLFHSLPVHMGRAAQAVRSLDGKIASHVQEILSGIQTVKDFCREKTECERLAEKTEERAAAHALSARWEGKFILGVEGISAISLSVTLGFGCWRVWDHSLTLGTLLVVVRYLTMLYSPVGRLSQLFAVSQRAAASAVRIEELFAEEEERYGSETQSAAPFAEEQILFRDVHFAYDGKTDVLRGIDLSVRRGEWIGIVGPSGSGKSTLLQLMERFYESKTGKIEINGTPITSWDLKTLRSFMAVVPQNPLLFSGTIADNIRYGAPGASDKDIESAARGAGIHDSICGFSEGYSTVVGERGVTLSGGERQRVAIARALLTKAPILLLDEPTSALDADSEARILADLDRIFEGRTVMMVTHSEQLLPFATRLFRLEQGRLCAVAEERA